MSDVRTRADGQDGGGPVDRDPGQARVEQQKWRKVAGVVHLHDGEVGQSAGPGEGGGGHDDQRPGRDRRPEDRG